MRGNILNFIFGQKLVHVVVVFITTVFVFTNLAPGTEAGTLGIGYTRPIVSHIVSSEFGEIENELYYEEAFSADELSLGMKQSYLNNDGLVKNSLRIDQTIEEENNIAIRDKQDDDLVLNEGKQVAVKQAPIKRDQIINYVVESGDTVSTIAQKFGISVNTILWENNLSSYSLIRPGDKLSILPESGVTHVVKSGDTLGAIAGRNDVEISEILEANSMSVNSKLSIGQKLVVPGGSKIVSVAAAVSSPTKSYTGIEAIKNIVKPAPQQTTANKMAWPTIGNRITQYFSWRHSGLDIANKLGTPLFASDTGTVEFAGWSNGYGNNILIDHGGGKKTRYAHMSKFYSGKGDDVTKGEAIGEMGSTGWSTGSHIHFEVIIDGVKYNPLNYIR